MSKMFKPRVAVAQRTVLLKFYRLIYHEFPSFLRAGPSTNPSRSCRVGYPQITWCDAIVETLAKSERRQLSLRQTRCVRVNYNQKRTAERKNNKQHLRSPEHTRPSVFFTTLLSLEDADQPQYSAMGSCRAMQAIKTLAVVGSFIFHATQALPEGFQKTEKMRVAKTIIPLQLVWIDIDRAFLIDQRGYIFICNPDQNNFPTEKYLTVKYIRALYVYLGKGGAKAFLQPARERLNPHPDEQMLTPFFL